MLLVQLWPLSLRRQDPDTQRLDWRTCRAQGAGFWKCPEDELRTCASIALMGELSKTREAGLYIFPSFLPFSRFLFVCWLVCFCFGIAGNRPVYPCPEVMSHW